MCKLILIRHGQTTWNAERRLQGHQDSPLSPRGILEAEAVGRRLANEPLTALYSSDLSRASHTAEILNAAHHLPLVQRADLREVNLGQWEGKTASELEQDETEADLLAKWREDSLTNRPPGGERLEELQARVVSALEEIAEDHPEGLIAVVTHGGVIKAAVAWVLGLPLDHQRRFEVGNASITTLVLGPKRSLLLNLNDRSHCESIENR
jgi:alpha-ribazole phosphatase